MNPTNYPLLSDLDEANAPWNQPSEQFSIRNVSVSLTIEIPELAIEVSDDNDEREIEEAVRQQLSITSLPSGAYISDIYIE